MSATPRERPINLRDWQVRAAIAGRLSQLWVPVKDVSDKVYEVVPSLLGHCGDLWDFRRHLDKPKAIRCPFGCVGDRLGGREAWGVGTRPDPFAGWRDGIEYRADELGLAERELLPLHAVSVPEDVDLDAFRGGWNGPAIMPRWASRLTFELLAIDVRQVQRATEDDARACGIIPPQGAEACPCQGPDEDPGPSHIAACPWRDVDYDPIGVPLLDEMAIRWNEEHARRAPWSGNPCSWVLGVRRIDA